MRPKVVLILTAVFLLVSVNFVSGQTTKTGTSAGQSKKPELKKPRGRRYRLNPGDVLEITYRYTPEYNQTVTIHPDGFIVLPIVGELEVADLTLKETKALIYKRASKRLRDPEISLFLKEFQKPYYIVAGEIVKPGRFEMDEDITALQAVMLAGGFRISAKSSKVYVFRKINKEMAEVKLLDLKKIRKTSDLENDLALESGDIVFVPRNNYSKFEKYIRLTSIGSLLNPIIR